MNNRNQLYKSSVYQKFQKVCRRLQRLLQAGSHASSEKIKLLTRRRDRCLAQLMSVTLSPVKAGSAVAVALLLSAQANAQQCNQFNDATAANPIIQAQNQGLSQPFFVDIDGDGDLDCYVTGSDRKPVFFKNEGTKTVPYYVQDDKDGGFQNYTDPASGARSGNGPQFADLDGDGDMDCFIPEGYKDYYQAKFRVVYYENIGTKNKPYFKINGKKNPLDFVAGFDLLNVRIADMDGDGDYDLFYSDYYSYLVFSNTGTKTQPSFDYVTSGNSGRGEDRVYYDYNHDGLADYFAFGKVYRNTGPTDGSPFNYVVDPNGPVFNAPYILQTLTDLTDDGVPEAFGVFCDAGTTTPVPVIHSSSAASGTLTRLVASPRDSSYRYQWQRNGKDIAGAVKDVLFTPASGLYTVKITNPCGTGISLPYKLSDSAAILANASAIQTAKMPNIGTQPSITAYPNPFTQQFSLHLGSSYSAGTVIKITDIQGRIISTAKVNNTTIQLGSNLQKGVYVVAVLQNNAVVFTQKIIKE